MVLAPSVVLIKTTCDTSSQLISNTAIPMTTQELQNTSYILGLCTWNGNAWKCGCRDAACMQSYWQVQRVKQ